MTPFTTRCGSGVGDSPCAFEALKISCWTSCFAASTTGRRGRGLFGRNGNGGDFTPCRCSIGIRRSRRSALCGRRVGGESLPHRLASQVDGDRYSIPLSTVLFRADGGQLEEHSSSPFVRRSSDSLRIYIPCRRPDNVTQKTGGIRIPLTFSASLPDPDVLAQEIVDDLQDALDQFAAIAGALRERRSTGP